MTLWTFLQCKHKVCVCCQSKHPVCCWLSRLCDALTGYWWSQRRREAIIRAQTDPSEPLAELLAAGVGGPWSRCLSAGFTLLTNRKDTQNSHLHASGEVQRRREFDLFSLLWSRFSFPRSERCASHRSASPSDAGSAASDLGLIRVLPSDQFRVSVNTFGWFQKNKKQKHGSVLDCLSTKGIMIFSDMSTGTNSPKVHPPNGTRFYTFQASELCDFRPFYTVCGFSFFFQCLSVLYCFEKGCCVAFIVWYLCVRLSAELSFGCFLPACVDWPLQTPIAQS